MPRNKKCLVFWLLIPFILEIFVFNFRYFRSLNDKEVKFEQMTIGSGLEETAPLEYLLTDSHNSTIEITGLDDTIRYVYLDIMTWDNHGEDMPTMATLLVSDEGNRFYHQKDDGVTECFAPFEATKYYRIHPYGRVYGIKIHLPDHIDIAGLSASYKKIEKVKINEIRLNVRVPFQFSLWRMAVMIGIVLAIWAFRPASPLYRERLMLSKPKQRAIVISLALICIVFSSLVTVLDPFKFHHTQYNQLTESLAQGVPYLMDQPDPKLVAEENPYDTSVRTEKDISYKWDHAYYQGHYYVYFGVVPVLLFYLPFYLITHYQLQIWMICPFLAAVTIIMFFYWLYLVCKRWFSEVSLGVYCLLSVIMVLSSGIYLFMVNDNLYTLAPFLSIALAMTGMVLYMKADEKQKAEKKEGRPYKSRRFLLAGGSLCMALIAGCRPHLLIILLAVGFLLYDGIRQWKKSEVKSLLFDLFCFAVPFAVVAIVLMHYNFVRFGSVFDFGSRYNLTTDDLTHRGFYMGRLIDGLYAYLVQPINVGTKFPYVFPVPVQSGYLGLTIREDMYGGIFNVKPFFCILFLLPFVRKDLKTKKLLGFVWVLFISSLIVLCIDTQMAGFLHRYENDFAWMLSMAAVVIWLSLFHNMQNRSAQNTMIRLTIAAVLIGAGIDFFISTYFIRNSLREYYQIAQYF